MGHLPVIDIAILTIVGILEILLALYFFIKYQVNISIIAYGCFCLCVGFWNITNGLPLLLERDTILFDMLGRLAFFWAGAIFYFLVLFTNNFPFRVNIPKNIVKVWPFFIIIIFLYLLFFTKLLIIGFMNNPTGDTIYGDYFFIYVIYIVAMFFYVIFKLYNKRKYLYGYQLQLVNILSIGILTSGTIGIIVQLLLPYFFETRSIFYSLGPASSAIWFAITARIILKSK